MEMIHYHFTDEATLKSACMPFIKNGALFIKTAVVYGLGTILQVSLKLMAEPSSLVFKGKVVWVTSKNDQNQMAQGIGVQFLEEEMEAVHMQIEAVVPRAFAKDNDSFLK